MDNFMNMPPAPVIEDKPSLGISFDGLIGTNALAPVTTVAEIVTDLPVSSKKIKVKKSTEVDVKPADIVENTIYADSYEYTNSMLRTTISQVDELASELKIELDRVRSSNQIKNKYMYIPNISSAISSAINVKLQAIKEINSSIKSANDAEYRRYKDARASEVVDDTKMIMDTYTAFVKTPVGSIPGLNVSMPSTSDITSLTSGIIRADTTSQEVQDSKFNSYLNNLTPEQNMMLNENNPNIEEVIVFDQASGKKYFQWIDKTTGSAVPNMPQTNSMFLEDYTINPRTRMATNNNLRKSLRVIYINEDL